jgi:eukaryotic-like serine/threonine-protein kinase
MAGMTPPLIAGKYALLRRLGQGGMAEVFLAKHEADGGFQKLVVIKRTLSHLTGSEFTTMFLEEARLASDLRHPNIVTILDIGKSDGAYFIVMEFLHGQDIRKLQRKVASYGQSVPLGVASQMIIDAANGLHHAHIKRDLEGRDLQIVHRDVSPQNIIVTYEGATKIVDFGIAKAAGQTTQTVAGVLKGKYTYMSPEQATGEALDARTDQFALAIVFWELLTMRRLYKRDTEALTLEAIVEGQPPPPSRFRPDLPAAIDDIIMTALQKDRRRRFRDCQEFALALEDAVRTEAIAHSPTRLSQYMRKLFADALVEESALGVVNHDGSLTSRALVAPIKPPSRVEPAVLERKPTTPPVARQDPEPTAADRKGSRSKTSEVRQPVPRERPSERRRDPEPESVAVVVAEPKVPRKEASAQRPVPPRNPSPSDPRLPYLMASMVGVVAVVGMALWWVSRASLVGLVIRSEPRGAHITFDGVDTGQVTPAPLDGVRAEEAHRIRLELAGYETLDEVVIPAKGQRTVEVKLELAPKR